MNTRNRVISALLCILMLPLCACKDNTPHPENEILSFYIESDPVTLDPQIATEYSDIMLVANLFEGLVRIDSDGKIIPGMAESWTVSDDNLTYTFNMVKGTQWSNGTEVTADDFVFGITRTLTPETCSINAPDLFPIKNASEVYAGSAEPDTLGITALDKHTLKIELEYETNSLLQALTEPVAMPCNEEFFNSTKGKYGKDADLIITNGPFKIRENYGWDHDKYIYIRRSDFYKAANEAIPLGVNFTYSGTPKNPIEALAAQEIDLCEIYGNQLAEAAEKNLNVTTTSNSLWGIFFNTEIKAFKNAKLRISLLASLDRESLLENTPESYVKTTDLISSDVDFADVNYRDSVGTPSLMEVDDTQAMFKTATKELENNGIELNSSYTIIYLDNDTCSELVTSMIEQWNKTTGCYFNKQPLARSELESRLNSGDYEIAIAPLNTAIDSPMEFFSKFTAGSPDNYINLNYPDYDTFIETALTESGENAIASLGQAEEYLVEYGYLFPLFYESRYFASPSNVSGAIFSVTSDAIYFSQITKITEE